MSKGKRSKSYMAGVTNQQAAKTTAPVVPNSGAGKSMKSSSTPQKAMKKCKSGGGY